MLYALSLLLLHPTQAQVSMADSTIRFLQLDVSYRGGLPSGAWQPDWGYTSLLGVEIGAKNKQNLYLRVGAHFLFSDRVAINDALDAITTPEGLLITDDGQLSQYELLGTGLMIPLTIGSILLQHSPNPNSGWYLEVGGHYLQHKIRVRPLEGQVAALAGAYAKGYDQLRGGFGLQEGVGYRFFANRGDLNVGVGLAFSQTYTQHLRTAFFPTGATTPASAWDFWWGIQVNWTYPIYRRAPEKAYFY